MQNIHRSLARMRSKIQSMQLVPSVKPLAVFIIFGPQLMPFTTNLFKQCMLEVHALESASTYKAEEFTLGIGKSGPDNSLDS